MLASTLIYPFPLPTPGSGIYLACSLQSINQLLSLTAHYLHVAPLKSLKNEALRNGILSNFPTFTMYHCFPSSFNKSRLAFLQLFQWAKQTPTGGALSHRVLSLCAQVPHHHTVPPELPRRKQQVSSVSMPLSCLIFLCGTSLTNNRG